MIVFIDRTAHCTQRIVAIGEYIRNREFRKSRCTCRLYDSDKGNIESAQLPHLLLHSDDVSAVYLRSNVLETDFEILKSDASWLEEYNDLQKDAERRIADEQGYIS